MSARRIVSFGCVVLLAAAYVAPVWAQAEVTPPEGFTLLPDELAPDFDFAFGLKPAAGAKQAAKAMINCLGPRDHYTLQVGEGLALLDRVQGGQPKRLAKWAIAPREEPAQVCVKRRGQRMTIIVGDQVLGTVTDGRFTGGRVGYGPAAATDRFVEPHCQPTGPIYLADDFMRGGGEQGAWEPLSGQWKTVTVGEPRLGANPFSYAVASPTPAIAATGHWFWDDYAVECAAKPPLGAR